LAPTSISIGREGDHVAQDVGVGGLLHDRAKVHHLVGHRGFLESGWLSQPDLDHEPSMTTTKPLARYSAMGARFASGFAPSSYTINRDTTG